MPEVQSICLGFFKAKHTIGQMLRRSSISSASKYLAPSSRPLKACKFLGIYIPVSQCAYSWKDVLCLHLFLIIYLSQLLTGSFFQALSSAVTKALIPKLKMLREKWGKYVPSCCSLKVTQPSSTQLSEKYVSRKRKQPGKGSRARIPLLGAAAMSHHPPNMGFRWKKKKKEEEKIIIGCSSHRGPQPQLPAPLLHAYPFFIFETYQSGTNNN